MSSVFLVPPVSVMLFELILKLDVHKQSLKVDSALIQYMKRKKKRKTGEIMKDTKTTIECLVQVSI